MHKRRDYVLSVVVPVYNEETGLFKFHQSLVDILQKNVPDSYEIIYCDDGSADDTARLIVGWHARNPRVKLVSLSRNFGKESALSAGIAIAHGQAVLSMDGDRQHPVDLIPDFIRSWRARAQVVIGGCTSNNNVSW